MKIMVSACLLPCEEIFTDMGIKAPIRMLGSKEANRLRFEAITEAMKKKGL